MLSRLEKTWEFGDEVFRITLRKRIGRRSPSRVILQRPVRRSSFMAWMAREVRAIDGGVVGGCRQIQTSGR